MISALSATASTICARRLRRWCRRAPSIIRKTRCRTRRCGIWRPKSPVKRSTASCTRNCRNQSTVETDSWTERNNKSVRIEQTIFVERGRASARSCSARAAPPSSRSVRIRRKEIAEILGVARAPVPVRLKVRERLGRRPRTVTGKWGWNSPRNDRGTSLRAKRSNPSSRRKAGLLPAWAGLRSSSYGGQVRSLCSLAQTLRVCRRQ